MQGPGHRFDPGRSRLRAKFAASASSCTRRTAGERLRGRRQSDNSPGSKQSKGSPRCVAVRSFSRRRRARHHRCTRLRRPGAGRHPQPRQDRHRPSGVVGSVLVRRRIRQAGRLRRRPVRRVAEAVRTKLGLKAIAVEYLKVTPADRIAAIVDRRADLECGSTTNNAERRQKVAFTVPHFVTGARYLVRADADRRAAGFRGQEAGVDHGHDAAEGDRPAPTRSGCSASPSSRRRTMRARSRWWRRARPTASRWTTCCCTACAPAGPTRAGSRSWASSSRSRRWRSCSRRTTRSSSRSSTRR